MREHGRRRRGSTAAWVSLAVVGAAALLAAVALAAAAKGQAADDAEATRQVRQALDAARRRLGAAPLAGHQALQQRAERGARAMALAVLANPAKPQTPAELTDNSLLDGLSGTGKRAFQLSGASNPKELAGKAAAWQLLRHAELTHLGLAAWRVTLNGGQQAWVVLGVAAQVLPALTAERLNEGQREFALRCHLCGHRFAGRVVKPQGGNTGALAAPCPKCGLRFDLFGLDTSGRYHRPPWFLRGFKPHETADPLAAWLFVLAGFRYSSDRKLFGRDEVWQLAEETHRRRQGDCEDTAILLADWLGAMGCRARAVTGRVKRGGHAWVVLRQDGRDYILETTGGRGRLRRTPPRAAVLPQYAPNIQFDRTGVWFRRRNAWTADYFNDKEWAKGPWTRAPAPAAPPKRR